MAQLKYPATAKDNTVDEYFGEKVADPYRWLENDTSAATAEWVREENLVSRKYLDNIPMRKAILKRLKETVNYEKRGMAFERGGTPTATTDCRTSRCSTRWTATMRPSASGACGSTLTR